MKNVCLFLIFSLIVSSCIVTEEECEFENYTYELSDEMKEWLPDSSLSKYIFYKADNGFEESYWVNTTYTGTWNALPDHCNNRRRYIYLYIESTVSRSNIKIDIQASPRGEHLYVRFNQFISNFNFNDRTSSKISSAINHHQFEYLDIESKHEFLSNFTSAGITYNEVIKITLLPAEGGILKPQTPEIVYIAKHYGIIAYKQFDGLSWELIKR